MPRRKEWVCECEWNCVCGNCKNDECECECHCIDDLSDEELMSIMIKKGNMVMSDLCGKTRNHLMQLIVENTDDPEMILKEGVNKLEKNLKKSKKNAVYDKRLAGLIDLADREGTKKLQTLLRKTSVRPKHKHNGKKRNKLPKSRQISRHAKVDCHS